MLGNLVVKSGTGIVWYDKSVLYTKKKVNCSDGIIHRLCAWLNVSVFVVTSDN